MRIHRDHTEAGFTLVELLVVLVITGVLAGIAVPALLLQKRKAHEASAKSDVKAITKEVLAFYVDGRGPLNVDASHGAWQLTSGVTVIAVGRLSEHNTISADSYVVSDLDYCLSVRNTKVDALSWTADGTNLRPGHC